jgi:NitT/TauT family transport system permease protein
VTRLVNRHPGRAGALALGALPLVLLALAYAIGSDARLAANPHDKLLPAPATLADTALRLATQPDPRSGAVLLWADTAASLARLAWGVGASALLGFTVGVAMGTVPLVRATLAPLAAVLSMIPPLALLPILFIVLGLGELSKIVLIGFGVAPFLIRDLAARALELPREQLVKAQTLGANTWQIALRVIMPQLVPGLIQGMRLTLGPAWLFLIAAEAIAATDGLGYRIFLVRRYLAMDVILPYVAWITLLAYVLDRLLAAAGRRISPWTVGA